MIYSYHNTLKKNYFDDIATFKKDFILSRFLYKNKYQDNIILDNVINLILLLIDDVYVDNKENNKNIYKYNYNTKIDHKKYLYIVS
jgi:hypothetical protein